jgi:meso-butanediol dehydrogenase/(S,S)-butanediol dehydrogenase/diacetyl reductase
VRRFKDKVVIVTGASSGIGAAVAKLMASEGAAIYGVARNLDGLKLTAQEIEASGNTVSVGAYDLTDPQQCRSVVKDCLDQYGHLDVLINCAGGHVFRPLDEITEELWFRDIATNLGSTFFLSQAAIPYLLVTNGNIVNIGSLASVEGQAYSAAYCSAKHGLIGLTKALSLEYSGSGIRINALCPGGTNTPQIDKVGIPESADLNLIMRTAGLRGMLEAEEVAATIAFLASSDAAAIHGSVIMADQGKTAG